jgi:predicted aldo/keto reductase-like oxidoreductase
MEPFEKNLTRRDFLIRSAATAATAALYGALPGCSDTTEPAVKPTNPVLFPVRTLGRTGLQVSILSFGGGSLFLYNPDGQWEAMLEQAVAAGINLFDTCSCYRLEGTKTSEERFAEVLLPHRRRLAISTKFDARTSDGAAAEVEGSMLRLKTDYVDILLMHHIKSTDDLAAIEQGAYRRLVQFKEEGVARFIGFSSMSSASKSKELLENLDFDVVMLALNPTQYGDYARTVLPVAREKGVGIIAMKVMSNLVGVSATARELLEYAWTLEGVSSAVIGQFGEEMQRENIGLAVEFGKGGRSMTDRGALEARLAPLAGPHSLGWARPDYRDGAPA